MFGWICRSHHLYLKGIVKSPFLALYHIISLQGDQLTKDDKKCVINILMSAINRGDLGRCLFDELEKDVGSTIRLCSIDQASAIEKNGHLSIYIELINGCNTLESIPFLLASLDSKVVVRSESWAREIVETEEESLWTPASNNLTDGYETDYCGHKGKTMTRIEYTKVYRDYLSNPLLSQLALDRLAVLRQDFGRNCVDESLLLSKKKKIDQRCKKTIRSLVIKYKSKEETFWDGDSGYW